jgi:hypothetical protein
MHETARLAGIAEITEVLPPVPTGS